MSIPPIAMGSDGFFHPASEAEVIALVNYARAHNLEIRGRGATHSVAWSIYTDPANGTPPNRTLQQSPPPGGINLAFDQMRALDWIDEAAGVIEAEPGINLGWDPEDPFGVSTLENSLLHQIYEKGWAVNTLGGITHQTLAGFTATGSAGGSTRYAWDNAVAFRVVDGMGNAEWIDQSHEHFDAIGTSMGLLGLVTKIRLQLVPMYNIEGTEITTPMSGLDAPMDFFGPGDASQPSLQQYLAETPYTRIVWWPQKGAERIQTWKAVPVAASDQNLEPYEQFPPNFGGQTEMFAGSIVFVLFGNTNPFRIIGLCWQKACHYLECLASVLRRSGKGEIARFLTFLLGCIVALLLGALGSVLGFVSGLVRMLFPKLLPIFNPMTKPGEETKFSDWYWRSLCMDNTVSDGLLGTEFTEIWVPIGRAQQVMNLYQEMFEQGGYDATGYFSTEVYGGPPSSGWMHPGYTDGSDEYKDGTVRIDVYWFRDNKGVPNCDEGFLEQYWQVLRDNNVPFRLHWGKFVPRYAFDDWAAYYRANLPRFDDFMALRAARDPHGVFFTGYWKKRLTGTE
ncbi:FAD-binding protein [uncultured Erythrobacter sp.]|uniref:FAD-binding protein n=1 Tax=uncultured Erythrobacter sp. TaxID=263913 RepID=UPI0026083BCE|nr:FAD-binding protein [uncultured Erythrobacter sp.]